MEQALSATFRRWAREPFHTLKANCAFSVLDYAEAVTGRRADPDPRQLFQALKIDGPMLGACFSVIEGLGWARVDEERRGDVGLVQLADGLTACICAAPQVGQSLPSWVARRPRGFASLPVTAEMVWRAPCLRS
nr:hypothetical protein VO57_12415 [Citromicrobium sp. JL2201]